MKRSLTLFFFICAQIIYAQSNKNAYKFGSINQSDYELTVYDKDSTANAVFLFERGKTTFHQKSTSVVIRTKYYAKVKIFNKEGLASATVKIPIYNNNRSAEVVKDIRGVTHNGTQKTSLSKKHIYTEKINDNWSEVKFTMPNVKNNSIIEYEYVFESPFLFTFQGWEFQSEIPKIHSEFYALIPGNYVYNRRLIGYKKLFKNAADIKKNCFSITGYGQADCEELTYVMKDVPAFIEEDYMTSKDNYLSGIKFELSEFKRFDGGTERFTKTWKSVDKEFKTEKSIGKQLRKADHIKKLLPIEILQGDTSVEKAKKVYKHIQKHFTWNKKYRVFKEVNVKDAYQKKVGNATEINIALLNALNSAGFDTELMLAATRNKGLPTKLHPVMTDFNYALVKLNIGDKSYLLDATEKNLPFAMLPFRILNAYGRVMNFEKGSYWHPIKSQHKTQTRTSLNLKLNEDGNLVGLMNTVNNGYSGIKQRIKFETSGEEDYLDNIEKDNLDLSITSYKNDNLYTTDKPFSEIFGIEIESDLTKETLIISPFLLYKINENPFKLKDRTYPVDFGYDFLDSYMLKLEIPKNYKVKTLPENVAFKLPNNGGIYVFKVIQNGDKLSLISRIKLYRSFFTPNEYPYLKEFFNQIIKTHKSLITLEKINQ